MIRLWEQFKSSSTITKLALFALGATWSIVFIVIIVGAVLLRGSSSQAQLPDPAVITPVITLEPAAGMINTPVTIRGQGWSPDSTVLIYLASLDEIDLPATRQPTRLPTRRVNLPLWLSFQRTLVGKIWA